MKKISLTLLGLSCILSANAQIWNANSCGDAETNTSYPIGNVVIDNWLRVGFNTYSCPVPAVVGNYPLTVSGAGSVAPNIFLYDPSDNFPRTILAQSKTQSLNLFVNSKPSNGPGLSLYGSMSTLTMPDYPPSSGNYAHATSAYPLGATPYVPTFPGMFQSVSYSFGVPANGIAFQHVLVGNPGSPTPYTDLFHITNNGDAQITGNIYLAKNSDNDYRTISGLTDTKGLKLYCNSSTTDGPAIEMFGDMNNIVPPVIPNTPGLMQFTCNNLPINPPYVHGFIFQTSPGTPGAPSTQTFVIDKSGNARFCMNSSNWPTPADRLTVDGDLYLYNTPDNTQRHIYARSGTGGISVVSGNDAVQGADGAVMSLYATSNSGTPGAIVMTSTGNISGHGTDLALSYRFYSSTDNTDHNNLLINKQGQGIYGMDVQLSNITGSDVFTIKNSIGFYNPNDANWRTINGNSLHQAVAISAKTGSTDGASIELYGQSYTSDATRNGSMHFTAYGTTGQGYQFASYNPSGGTYTTDMGIMNNGKVFIGPASMASSLPGTYNLYVANGILTEKVRVAIQGTVDWADYVFAKDYKLMPLKQVESYVKENKHLPDVPAATEVVKDGIDVAAMDAKLMQKVEELTLYVIQQQKQIEALQQKLDAKSKN